jgi:hypothetical protein
MIMNPKKEDPADLLIQVFWAIAGLFAFMIVGGTIVAIASRMNPDNQPTQLEKAIESPSINAPSNSPSIKPTP